MTCADAARWGGEAAALYPSLSLTLHSAPHSLAVRNWPGFVNGLFNNGCIRCGCPYAKWTNVCTSYIAACVCFGWMCSACADRHSRACLAISRCPPPTTHTHHKNLATTIITTHRHHTTGRGQDKGGALPHRPAVLPGACARSVRGGRARCRVVVRDLTNMTERAALTRAGARRARARTHTHYCCFFGRRAASALRQRSQHRQKITENKNADNQQTTTNKHKRVSKRTSRTRTWARRRAC